MIENVTSAAVPMKVDLDFNLTVMAAGLYRLLAERTDQHCRRRAQCPASP